jgi:nitroimidazol reductase NimA-like FMN-containing flavoprotein (pyridoxamine 5'-phosphate oxidase superfamily)
VATSFNDDPRASTVYYYVDAHFNFYFVTKRNTSKYLNIEMNPRAAFVVGTGPEHISIQGHGTVELIIDEDEHEEMLEHIMDALLDKKVELWPIEELKKFRDRHEILFKIIPHRMFFMNLDSKAHAHTISEEYMQVVP